MKDHQTPRKDLSHRRPKESPSSKSIPDQSKKSQKVAKKNLNLEFSSVSEDLLTGSVTESFNFSPVSEVLSDNLIGESLDKFVSDNQIGESFDSLESLPSLEEVTPSDCCSSSKILTVNDGSADVEVVVVENLLKQARLEVLRSRDVHSGTKKLLDALIEVSVREFHVLPVEKDRIDVIISNRGRILVLCFVMWLMVSMSVILSSRRSSVSFYPPPT